MSPHDQHEHEPDRNGAERNGADRNGAGGEPHWNELDAVRRFPSEDEWLDLPMPTDEQLPDSELDGNDGSSFADRVLQANREERELDERLAELDRLLPRELLLQFRAPEPSASFAADTTDRAQQDRRQRWAETLSRYVAPEPSPEFVNRTLAALQDDQDPTRAAAQQGRTQQGRSQQGKAPTSATTTTPRRAGPSAGSRSSNRTNLPMWGLLSAAAAALLWLTLTDRTRQPLEVRIADQAPTSVAYVDSTTPMAAILSHVADDEEPHALFDEPVDGLWLVGESGELR